MTDPLQIKRSRCAAGHKAMWHAEFDGLPAENSRQTGSTACRVAVRLYKDTFTCEVKAGNLSAEWVKRLGLSETVAVGAGSFDAHIGALGEKSNLTT